MCDNKNVSIDNGTAILTLFLEADVCDTAMAWRPSAVLTAMQQAAHYAREALGIGWSTLATTGALWVVSRVNVKFVCIPQMGEKVILRATPQPSVKALFPWLFEFLDEKGNILGTGECLWNLMDASTRRIVFHPEIACRIPAPTQIISTTSLPDAACELESAPRAGNLTPVYTDLDINGHASHLRYIDWCCNALGSRLMAQYYIPEFRISYMCEVLPSQPLRTELRVNGVNFSFSGYYEDLPAFVVDGTLLRRK